jgi:thioredoxin-like negative regulator of GroEL
MDPADETQAAYLLACVLEAAQQPGEAVEILHGILQKDLHYADVEERYRRLKPLAAEVGRTEPNIGTEEVRDS